MSIEGMPRSEDVFARFDFTTVIDDVLDDFLLQPELSIAFDSYKRLQHALVDLSIEKYASDSEEYYMSNRGIAFVNGCALALTLADTLSAELGVGQKAYRKSIYHRLGFKDSSENGGSLTLIINNLEHVLTKSRIQDELMIEILGNATELLVTLGEDKSEWEAAEEGFLYILVAAREAIQSELERKQIKLARKAMALKENPEFDIAIARILYSD